MIFCPLSQCVGKTSVDVPSMQGMTIETELSQSWSDLLSEKKMLSRFWKKFTNSCLYKIFVWFFTNSEKGYFCTDIKNFIKIGREAGRQERAAQKKFAGAVVRHPNAHMRGNRVQAFLNFNFIPAYWRLYSSLTVCKLLNANVCVQNFCWRAL